MSYAATILADSISPSGHRLTTMEVTFPRIVLSEFNTHRVFSRNSASSRAIPVAKQLRRVLEDPFIPDQFGINRSGMQANRYLGGVKRSEAIRIHRRGLARAATTVFEELLGESLSGHMFGYDPATGFASYEALLGNLDAALNRLEAELKSGDMADIPVLNIHKQDVNRLLEPWMWHTVIVTATEWGNFFALRNHADAQRQIQLVAAQMQTAYKKSQPIRLKPGVWHLPLMQPGEGEPQPNDPQFWAKVCAGRCARVSYLSHDGQRDTAKDIELYERLTSGGHMSPLEHIARPMNMSELAVDEWSGNFRGWHQFRKDIPNEDNFARVNKSV